MVCVTVLAMGNTRGFKRDSECFKTLEQRRLKGARLLEQGVHQSEVARRVGVHRQSVSRWARQLEEAGRAGLKRAGRAGRKPKLSAADLKRIEQGLKQGPEALGYSTSLWTSQRVAHLIEQECGVQYSSTHVWRLLKQLGWSCQRPVGRALERDEEAIRRWKKRRFPELKKTPHASTKPSSSSTKAG
jgi:putative transposase